MNTNLKVDAVAFLLKTLEGMENDIDYSYPKNSFSGGSGMFDVNNAHTSLQMVQSRIRTLRNFLKALQPQAQSDVQ